MYNTYSLTLAFAASTAFLLHPLYYCSFAFHEFDLHFLGMMQLHLAAFFGWPFSRLAYTIPGNLDGVVEGDICGQTFMGDRSSCIYLIYLHESLFSYMKPLGFAR